MAGGLKNALRQEPRLYVWDYGDRTPCRHAWIDPEEPLPSRRPVAPIIGTLPEMMQRGRTYRCDNCGLTFVVPPR